VPVYGDLVLAPMDGISGSPFRALCRAFGSAMSYTEFINAMDVLQDRPKLKRQLAFLDKERPVVYQVFDSEPERMLLAARTLLLREPDIMDINMGCASPSVSGRGAGAGLLRDPKAAGRLVGLLSKELGIPITAKIRLGWDAASRNYIQVAREIEENGGALIAVHGRTRSQRYSGEADWDAIAEIKQSVSIPVLANGDVRTVADIRRIKAQTGCDGVMIGRAAIGNPWIFARRDRMDVPNSEVRETMQNHLEQMLSFYGEPLGLILFRRHADRYLQPLELNAEERLKLFRSENPGEFSLALDRILA
jgi:tRNA-dihydrouridine synthase B